MDDRNRLEESLKSFTLAERELLEAASAINFREALQRPQPWDSQDHKDTVARFWKAKMAVNRERLENGMPDWKDQFKNLLRAHSEAEHKYKAFATLLQEAGVDTTSLIDEFWPEISERIGK